MSQYLITIIEANGTQRVKRMTTQGLTIGRGADNDVVLSDLVASRHHLQIKLKENNYYVTDLNSANGTYLDNMRLAPNNPSKWVAGQALRVGQAVLHLNPSQETTREASTQAAQSPQEETNILRQQIESNLQKVNSQKANLQRNNKRLNISNTLFNAASTFIAGLATLSGQGLVGEGEAAWRLTCGIAALLALGATVISGLQQNLGTAQRLNQVSECAAKLRALQVETVAPSPNIAMVRKQYQTILSQYPEIDW